MPISWCQLTLTHVTWARSLALPRLGWGQPCHQGQLYCAAQARSMVCSSGCCSRCGAGPILLSSGPSGTALPLYPGEGCGQLSSAAALLGWASTTAQPSDINMAPVKSPTRDYPWPLVETHLHCYSKYFKTSNWLLCFLPVECGSLTSKC